VSAGGAVPATIAIIDGAVHAGLDGEALARLAQTDSARKAAAHDIGIATAQDATAGTTVSATMRIAAMAGIKVFATGGVGGVHRGAELNFDISSDLTELGRTPVAVVSAGVKSILDIAKTLEVLETQSVPVIGFRTDEFPAFFARDSGFKTPSRADDVVELATMLESHWFYGGKGALIANPIPEAAALQRSEIDGIIAEAISAADKKGIGGKALTPFLLERINQMSAGRSLEANIALVRHNAELATQLAAALS